MKKIAYTLAALTLTAATVAMADDSVNVNPAGAIGAITPDDTFPGACPRCFSQRRNEDLVAKYNDLLAGDAGGGQAQPKATDAADGQ